MRTILRMCAGPARIMAPLVLIAVAAMPARATLILGNLGATGNHALDISQGGAVAVEFAMTGTYGLTSVTAFLNFPNNATSSDITVSIFSDNSGDPGTSIATLTPAPGTPSPFPTTAGDFMFDAPSGTTVPLITGDNYWLVIQFSDGTKSLNWSSANTGQPYTGSGATFVQALTSTDEVTWTTATYSGTDGSVDAKPHFELDTPEPGTAGLSLIGFSGLLLAALASAVRRKSGCVPERSLP